MEYRTFGFGSPVGQFSRISRREDDRIPFPSVSTSVKVQLSDSVEMKKREGRTNQRAAVRFEHRDDTTVIRFSSQFFSGKVRVSPYAYTGDSTKIGSPGFKIELTACRYS